MCVALKVSLSPKCGVRIIGMTQVSPGGTKRCASPTTCLGLADAADRQRSRPVTKVGAPPARIAVIRCSVPLRDAGTCCAGDAKAALHEDPFGQFA